MFVKQHTPKKPAVEEEADAGTVVVSASAAASKNRPAGVVALLEQLKESLSPVASDSNYHHLHLTGQALCDDEVLRWVTTHEAY